MNQYFTRLAVVGGLTLAVLSCKKDETQVTLVNNATPQLTASATTATITRNNTSPAVTYSWTAADFNYKAAVTYTLQFAKAGTNFAKTVDYNVGTALSKSFNVTELNEVYNALDCTLTSVPTALDVRVKSSVGDNVSPQLSTTKGMTATPYLAVSLPTDQWALVGPAGNGWPSGTPTTENGIVLTWDCTQSAYTTRTALNAGPFKFRQDRGWSVNLGGVTGDYTKGIPLTLGGSDLTIATPGTYTVKLEVNRNAAGAPVSGKVTITP